MIKTILVDDEKPALKILARFLRDYPDIQIIGEFSNFSEALTQIKNEDIQMVFLDIDMPEANGLDAAKIIATINSDIDIVFVTAYDQFALAAFEMNTLDYIMKPVTKKRLDKTIERITRKRVASDDIVLRRQRDRFLNEIIAGKTGGLKNLEHQAKALGIDPKLPFSFFLLLRTAWNRRPDQAGPTDRAVSIEALVELLAADAGAIAWQTESGIGILDYFPVSGDGCAKEETVRASRLKEMVQAHFPGVSIAIGIAERQAGLANLAERFVQARNAAVIGMHVSPDLGSYHFLDSGFLPVLAQCIDQQKTAALISCTIGRIIDYDRTNGTELFRTMEKIILCDSLQSVAEKMFVHYKTILFRKQSIERILGHTLNSFEGRITLGVALALYYIEHSGSEID